MKHLILVGVFLGVAFLPEVQWMGVAATSGAITVSNQLVKAFEELRINKTHRYIVFFIRDEREIDVESIGPRDMAYDAFLDDLQKGGTGLCRFGVFNLQYDNETDHKIFLMLWMPDTAKIKQKMIYSSSFNTLKNSLQRIQAYITATDASEASMGAVEETLRNSH